MNDKIHWPDVLVLIVCLAAYALVAVIADQRVIAERERADSYRQVMLSCLNRQGFYFKDTQRAYICDAKEI